VEIDECIAYADALRVGGIDARVVVETVAREEVETSARGTVKVRDDRVSHPMVSDDIHEPTQEEGAIEVTYETLGDLVQRFYNHTMEIPVHRVQTMPNTRSGATMTRKVVNELIARRVTKALESRDVAKNLEPLAKGEDEQGDKNGDDYEGVNGGGNGNGFMPVARECTYQDFLKCQPLNFNRTEGVIRRLGHYRKDCLKLRNQNHGNKTGNKTRNKTGNKTGNNETIAKAYTIEGGGANPDSNVVTGTFLLNNYYASMLFDSGADRSFVSFTFSALLDVAPSTLDTSYAIELVDGRIS
ncbi:hypothetical protein Tco_0500550, partial [Tanacetum coccineum]